METLFISKDAALSREDSTLIVTPKGQRRVRIPIEGLRNVVLAGEAQLTTAVLGLCGRQGVRVTILDWYGNVTGSYEPANRTASGKIRLAQAAACLDTSRRLALAREVVLGAAHNMNANLRYRKYRGNTTLTDVIGRIRTLAESLPGAGTVEELMGFEGNIRSNYYAAWKAVDPRLDFGVRTRRPPNNEINCLISWFNGLAYTLCGNEIAKTNLDQGLSFLHSPREARSSLALDVSEVFKPAICDTLIFEMVLRGTMKDNWFEKHDGVCRLAEAGRTATLEAWSRKIEERGAEDKSYRDIIRAEALGIERHLLGMTPYTAWRRKV